MNIQSRTLAVGFADLESYHKYVMAKGGEAAIQLLSETFRLAGDIILAHSGRIIKYIGDGILFVLSDPAQSEVVARSITECFFREFEEGTLRFCAAIATGEVTLARIGHPSFQVDDIFGPTVNRAARLLKEISKNTDGTRYLLCEETQKLVNK